ncbi:unnamed protein product [Rotaria socialis]
MGRMGWDGNGLSHPTRSSDRDCINTQSKISKVLSAQFKRNKRMSIRVISIICFLLIVIEMSLCAAVIKRIENQVIDDKEVVLESTEMKELTHNNETILLRQKRGQCCNIFNTKCCCFVGHVKCINYGSPFHSPQCEECPMGWGFCLPAFDGEKDCEGCDLGFKC